MRPVFKITAAMATIAFLAACGHTPDVVGPVPDTLVARPAPVTLQQPNVIVVNRENLEEFNALVEGGAIIIAMPLEEFNKLIENNQQVMVFMSNQDAVIDTYESRITDPN